MKRPVLCVIIVFMMLSVLFSQDKSKTFMFEDGELWWGGVVVDGPKMPFGNEPYAHDLFGGMKGNQSQPLFISNMGRYVWCEDPFRFQFSRESLSVSSDFSVIQSGTAGKTLRDAFLYASSSFFPASGQMPDELLFTVPQYNTWIELMYDQNEKDILKYARDIINNGFPPGVLMIDDNWQENYGVWEFKAEKFKDPKAMITKLHKMGFKVMLWVCPFISPDSPVYRELAPQNLLMQENTAQRKPAIIRWWNGASAVLDLTNPEAVAWFHSQLQRLVNEYDVDGFKLDGGDDIYYTDDIHTFENKHANDHCERYGRIGLNFPLNEYRACWKLAGQPLAQRLRDKSHNWDDLRKLVPGILAQGLMGYAFVCPDMIGGGEYRSFLSAKTIDEELIVRSAECHALMPMMQFSVAPWRILDKENLLVVRSMALLHQKMGNKILSLAKQAARTGEPIVRHMEYVFPHQGLAEIKDQFMLGDSILVAPVVEKGAKKRWVKFPNGTWKSETGEIVNGPKTIQIDAPLQRLPWYERVK